MNLSKSGFDPENLIKNVELLRHLMTPKHTYDIFEKMDKMGGFSNVIFEMNLKLEEFITKNPGATEKIKEAKDNLQTLTEIHKWIHKLWEAGSAKENHNNHLTRLTISLMAEAATLKKENQKLTDTINLIEEKAA